MRAPLRPDELHLPGFHRIEVVDESGSTNTELVAAVRADPGAWPAPSALVAEHQTAGRGRAGRSWASPPHASLIVSTLLRPAVPAERLGWLPLLAGTAVVRAVSADDGGGPDDGAWGLAVKWPNDVLVRADSPVTGLGGYRKVAGILAEVVPEIVPAGGAGEPAAVVLGIGLNVSQTAAELPVETASSLALAGYGDLDRTALLAALLREVAVVVDRWEAAGGDPVTSGLADECARVSATLGTRVRAELAGDAGVVEGEAVRLDATGALVIRTAAGQERVVSAGDVHHLR
ncbi:biotin--[acetyl-CoA-carboxylase] ligase [Myceligenerans pegani]|uniref:biotin--[biotin carboxyl-carrier protein] ligase n=1 Tax=Myceligenerans pegani TaxID=2776917 RepID=A0ABR9N0I8_9MICO|nr:biotin--[acetyl-CoA-carboxylase] ligase [Myceligenerans sp. TRM 65318]MBE1877144.1 biotin--[acetyl-CoA-carboxylase] ligase [Myceligenerans sp. TRM 65318]MBE3019415.1 biotin--[acetyl-CoA-carboxylase] ligase [Myceligenerans sp. TRM 65318]